MRFMIIGRATKETEAGILPKPEAFAAMGKWNDELKRLEAARKDKEELENILRVLQTLVEYEREAALKMEAEGLLSVILLPTPRGLVIAQPKQNRR